MFAQQMSTSSPGVRGPRSLRAFPTSTIMMRITGTACLILLAVCPTPGQKAEPLSFEVASIKLAKPAGPGGVSSSRYTPGRVEYHSLSLREFVATAYRVKDYQISAPDWLRQQGWDIVAKLPEGAKSAQIPEMLQTLLVERFKLQVHREKKEASGLALVVASGGPNLKKSDEGGAPAGSATGKRMTGVRISSGPAGGRMIAPRATMAMLASVISTLLARPVADETQIPGTYAVELEYGPDDLAAMRAPMMPSPEAGAAAPATSAGPRASIFSSLQKLGLRLKSSKVTVEVIVVDHAERTPTEN